jgi:23S rRNA (cytidine2498-2'-O)-methyltransferase
MGLAGRHLREDGWALLTLKLPQWGMAEVAASALEMLREWYAVIGARQLFHNRNEITVALRPAGLRRDRVGGQTDARAFV